VVVGSVGSSPSGGAVPAITVSGGSVVVILVGAPTTDHSRSIVDSAPASPLIGLYGCGITWPYQAGLVSEIGSSRRAMIAKSTGTPPATAADSTSSVAPTSKLWYSVATSDH